MSNVLINTPPNFTDRASRVCWHVRKSLHTGLGGVDNNTKVPAHRILGRISRSDPDFAQNRSGGLKTSFPKLVHDFDWKSIPATAVQFRGVRGEFFAVFADFRDFWLEIALEGFEIPQTPGGDKSLF